MIDNRCTTPFIVDCDCIYNWRRSCPQTVNEDGIPGLIAKATCVDKCGRSVSRFHHLK